MDSYSTLVCLVIVACMFASNVTGFGSLDFSSSSDPEVWNGQSARQQLSPDKTKFNAGKLNWPTLSGPSVINSSRQSRSTSWGSPEEVKAQQWYKDMTKHATSNGNSQPKLKPSTMNRSPTRNRDLECSNDYGVKYYSLALQWPPGYCTASPEKCIKEPEEFTIHGMWATKSSQGNRGRDESPEFCCFDNSFNINAIMPLKHDLDTYWPSLFGPAQGFWKHEWLKHGTCARDTPKLKGEYNFFASTLAIVKSLSLKSHLASGGITPSSSRQYYISDLRTSVMNLTNNKQVRFACEKQHNSPIPLLSGLFICYDTNLRFTDCPTWSGRCGTSKVMVPQSNHSSRMRNFG